MEKLFVAAIILFFPTFVFASFSSFSHIHSVVGNSEQNVGLAETIVSKAFAFPSPANPDTQIGFRVTGGPIKLSFSLYDSVGQKLYQKEDTYASGYNRIPINQSLLGFDLPVGVYFFLLKDDGLKVMSKGKFGVVR